MKTCLIPSPQTETSILLFLYWPATPRLELQARTVSLNVSHFTIRCNFSSDIVKHMGQGGSQRHRSVLIWKVPVISVAERSCGGEGHWRGRRNNVHPWAYGRTCAQENQERSADKEESECVRVKIKGKKRGIMAACRHFYNPGLPERSILNSWSITISIHSYIHDSDYEKYMLPTMTGGHVTHV